MSEDDLLSTSLARYLDRLLIDKEQIIISQMIQVYRSLNIEPQAKLAIYQERVIEASILRSLIQDLKSNFNKSINNDES